MASSSHLLSSTSDRERQLFSIDASTGSAGQRADYEEAPPTRSMCRQLDRGPVPMVGHCKVLVDIVDGGMITHQRSCSRTCTAPCPRTLPPTLLWPFSVSMTKTGPNRKVSLFAWRPHCLSD